MADCTFSRLDNTGNFRKYPAARPNGFVRSVLMVAIRRYIQSRAPPSRYSRDVTRLRRRVKGKRRAKNAAQREGVDMRSKVDRSSWLLVTVTLTLLLTQPTFVVAASNPLCPGEDVFFNPGNGEDIVVPPGFKVSVFKSGLNFPTAVAFRGNSRRFEVFVLESGHGLPSRCNDETSAIVGGTFSLTNPFTPDILVFDQNGTKVRGPLGKPTNGGGGFQPSGPAIDIAFEHGRKGGRLFATDSNQSIRGGGQSNSSRIVIVDPDTGTVTPFITGLPTGDHPSEMLAFKDGWIYWSQGSTTNSSVVGHDNNNGANQQDIPCQQIKLSNNLFDSGDGHKTSGYSPHGTQRPGATVQAFESATGPGICDGTILRAKLNAANPKATIEPFSWGYRNPYGLRFAPKNHALQGNLFVTENGEDERGARPTNNSPDRLHIAKQNPDGSPDYHGWPDRFGFLDSTQAVFNPTGGPGDDLCNPPNPPTTGAACAAIVMAFNPQVKPTLAFPPQAITAPLALEPADVAAVGHDFAPDSFVFGVVRKGASLVSREGDFGFAKENGEPPAGHDIELVNFARKVERVHREQSRFAFNGKQADHFHDAEGTPRCKSIEDQAFVSIPALRGINRPNTAMFGPDDALYLVDYGAVRDFGQSDPRSRFVDAVPPCPTGGCSNAPLVQIPQTGVIWRISRDTTQRGGQGDEDKGGKGDKD